MARSRDAAARGDDWQTPLAALQERHRSTARELLGVHADLTVAWLDAQCQELAAILGAIALLGPSGEVAKERVHGLGDADELVGERIRGSQ